MKLLHITMKLVLALCLLAGLGSGAMLPSAHASSSSFRYYAYPQGEVGIQKPTIGFRIGDLGTELSILNYISLTIDGKEVRGEFDRETMSVTYVPKEPYSVGEHKVKASINFSGYEQAEQQWTFKIAATAVKEPTTDYSETQLKMVRAVNDYRTLYGLQPLSADAHLMMAAQLHADYIYMNKIDPSEVSLHDQKSSLPGFIGAKPGDRAEYVGYFDSVAEDVAYNTGTPIESIDKLFDAPYHRIPFLLSQAKHIGVAAVGPVVVLEFGFEEELKRELLVTPAAGDKYVPIQFDGHEDPDPIRMHKEAEYPVGYPIVARLTGSRPDEKITLLEAKVTDEQGQEVKLLRNSPDNDEHLIREVILTPLEPLQPDTTYTAYVKLSSERGGGKEAFERKWQFRTEPGDGVGKHKLHADVQAYLKLLDRSSVPHTAEISLNKQRYTLDGAPLELQVKPIVIDGSSYLWVRDLATALGAQVTWNDEQKAAIYTKKDRTVAFYTTRPAYAIQGKEIAGDVSAQLVDEQTMIPVRLLSEVLGAKVTYIEESHSIRIEY
ncbi:stalk domain-containing protein [Paenibacillus sp. YYML68]|uniref:stalk domain-containing protein n=1 Tax=Paenibacillus sp. YYML68 TaxID=2909250 RepID=UPI0024924344|nr:stalk domain-containing protein [Paenibacillus sp. YYML68]